MLLLEDFFWFVFNPNYGIKRFRPGMIKWHRDWLGPGPSYYWANIAIAVVLIWLGWSVI